MAEIKENKTVLVTGATGYVAGWLVKSLLEKGCRVHAAVRDPGKGEKIDHLDKLAGELPGSIRYFKTDLLEEGSYAEAMAGCDLVFHTASPFINIVKDPQKELIDPALIGTRNVLQEANRQDSVIRIVLTSSCAAIYGDNADLRNLEGSMITEEVWNTSSSLTRTPYSYSKTLAEKEAWRIAEEQKRWDLVVVNPSLVLGPSLNPSGSVTSESFRILKQFGDGTMRTGVPYFGMGIVDVREVAEAHIQAAFRPDAEGRHIITGHNSNFPEMAAILKRNFSSYPISGMTMPKALIWLVGPLISKSLSRGYIARNVGLPFKADNRKSREKLGITYRPLEETLCDSFRQMIDEEQF